MKKADVVIIGGSAAGITAALTCQRHYPNRDVLLTRKEKEVQIPCGIPYVFGTVVGDKTFDMAGLSENVAKECGYKTVVGQAESPNRHPDGMPGMAKTKVKLVFNKKTGELIGSQARGGYSVGELINTISACVQKKMTADDIATFQLGTRPAVTASPIAYQLVNAAEIAITKME